MEVSEGIKLSFGSFAENLTTKGLESVLCLKKELLKKEI